MDENKLDKIAFFITTVLFSIIVSLSVRLLIPNTADNTCNEHVSAGSK